MQEERLSELLNSLGREERGQLREMLDSAGQAAAPASAAKPLRACRFLSVPDEVRHLDTPSLERLTRELKAWRDEAKGARSVVSRTRVWLVFLLLRYAGARLGEVLALDETRDLDLESGCVRFPAENGTAGSRQVALPPQVLEEFALAASDPLFDAVRGHLPGLDQGYLRRKLYELADRTGIARELVNPRVLRSSRTVELLRGGVPPFAVQAILGNSTPFSVTSHMAFSDADMRRIIHHYIRKEASMRTSARNTFVGEVSSVRAGNILSEVELTTASGKRIVSVITNESLQNLGVEQGLTVAAIVKAPWVILVKDEQLEATSARNRFQGSITRINQGEISAEVIGELDDGTVMCALVTDESVKTLALQEGDKVWFLFKAFSVILNAD